MSEPRRANGQGYTEAQRRRMYLLVAARILRRRKSERVMAEEIVDALGVLAETYGDEAVERSLPRPVAALEAASRSRSLTVEAGLQGYGSLGAFIGAEVEEEILQHSGVPASTVFLKKREETPTHGSQLRAYPTYREFKAASGFAASLGRTNLTWHLGQLVFGALKTGTKLPSLADNNLQSSPTRPAMALLASLRDVERKHPSPSLRELKRELENILWGADRDG